MCRPAYTPASNSKFHWLTWFEGCSMEIMALQSSILRIIQLGYFKIRCKPLISHMHRTQLHVCAANSRLPLATARSSYSAVVKPSCAPYQIVKEQHNRRLVQSCTSTSWPVKVRSNRADHLKSCCRFSISKNINLGHSPSTNLMIFIKPVKIWYPWHWCHFVNFGWHWSTGSKVSRKKPGKA